MPRLAGYVLSAHARLRLTQRCKLRESELLQLLEVRAYKRVHTKSRASLADSDIEEFHTQYGLTFKELKAYGMVTLNAEYEHLLLWSCQDQRPLTIIVAVPDHVIITVLYADETATHDWSDKISEAAVADVKKKAEALLQSRESRTYEAFVCWLEGPERTQRRWVIKIGAAEPLTETLFAELATKARQHVNNGYDIRLTIRNKKMHSDIVLERELGDSASMELAGNSCATTE